MLTKFEIESQERHLALLEKIARSLENLDRSPRATCDYCQGVLNGVGDFKNLCDEPNHIIALDKYGEIHASSPEDGSYSIKIRYCPMCGRKLNKENT